MKRRRHRGEGRRDQLSRGHEAAAVFLFRRVPQLEVLLLERAGGGYEGEWCPVSGYCERGELPRHAARREVAEETGIELPALHEPDTLWSARRGKGGRQPVLKIFVFSALVPADTVVQLNYEHTDYTWLTPERAADRLPLAQQRRALMRVLEIWRP